MEKLSKSYHYLKVLSIILFTLFNLSYLSMSSQDIVAKFEKGRPEFIQFGSFILNYSKDKRFYTLTTQDSMIYYDHKKKLLRFGQKEKIDFFHDNREWYIKFNDSMICLDTIYGRKAANYTLERYRKINSVLSTIVLNGYIVDLHFDTLRNGRWKFTHIGISPVISTGNKTFTFQVDVSFNTLKDMIYNVLKNGETTHRFVLTHSYEGALRDILYYDYEYTENPRIIHEKCYQLDFKNIKATTKGGLSIIKTIENHNDSLNNREEKLILYYNILEFNRFGRLKYHYRRRLKDIDIFEYRDPKESNIITQ